MALHVFHFLGETCYKSIYQEGHFITLRKGGAVFRDRVICCRGTVERNTFALKLGNVKLSLPVFG